MFTVERMNMRERDERALEAPLSEGWPAFISADREAERWLPEVRKLFAELELVVLDSSGNPKAAGWAVPVAWDGTLENLPTGYSDSLRRAVSDHRSGRKPDTLVVCAIQVSADVRGRGLAAMLLDAFRAEARDRHCERVIVPVRPTLKSRYPLTPIETYAGWTRPDGTHFDPWVRTHLRLGASIIATAPESQHMEGSISDWMKWTGMAFPSSGDYVVPGGLSILSIDRDKDVGRYTEPNIWVQHRALSATTHGFNDA
jgi:GNAT superfamily N-acetyltransferase